MQTRIQEQLEVAEHLHGQSTQQLQEKDKELSELRDELAKGDEEREELRTRVTQVCAQQLPELNQKLADRDETLKALTAENEELRSHATHLVTVYLPVSQQHCTRTLHATDLTRQSVDCDRTFRTKSTRVSKRTKVCVYRWVIYRPRQIKKRFFKRRLIR